MKVRDDEIGSLLGFRTGVYMGTPDLGLHGDKIEYN
jgi:hypothetical protein